MSPAYCLDSNVFIESAKGPLAIDIAPGFWTALANHVQAGSILSIKAVRDELENGDDGLLAWADANCPQLFVANDDSATQKKMVTVQDAIAARPNPYPKQQVASFMSGADPWLIAFCAAHSHILVTEETLVGAAENKIKIPNICKVVGVQTVRTTGLMRALNIRLDRSGP